MNNDCCIGIDLGGTKTAFALVKDDGSILYELKKETSSGGFELLASMLEGSAELLLKAKELNLDVKAIGIGSPGRVDSKKGVVVDCTPNIKDWEGINLKDEFETKFNLPTFVDNDANVAAYGEYFFMKKENSKKSTIIILTLGTGLGSGIIYNEKIFRGRGLGSEIGHMIIDTKGRPCNCGQTGCFEMYVCGTAIETQAKERLYKYPNSKLNTIKDKITSYQIFEFAKEEDLFCQILIDEMAEYLAHSLVSLINIFDPDLILLGGGISRQKDMYFEKVQKIVEKTINYHHFNIDILQIAKTDEKAGLIGAGLIAFYGYEKGAI